MKKSDRNLIISLSIAVLMLAGLIAENIFLTLRSKTSAGEVLKVAVSPEGLKAKEKMDTKNEKYTGKIKERLTEAGLTPSPARYWKGLE